MRAAFVALALGLAGACFAGDEGKYMVPFVWNDVTGSRDMPWMGGGGRARWYKRDTTRPWDMDPRGPKIETRWGSSAGSGESPFDTGDRAIAYLAGVGMLKGWPAYPDGEGRPGDRAFPYRVTIVCVEPTVAILRFDLSAAIEDPIEFSFGAFPPNLRDNSSDQRVSGGGIRNAVMFGTHVASKGSLMWFSPEAKIPPTPLDLKSGHASLAVKGFTLEVESRGGEIVVRR
jgi:hypothetical protein